MRRIDLKTARSRLQHFENDTKESDPFHYRAMQVAAASFFGGIFGIVLVFASQALGWALLEQAGAVIVVLSIVVGGATVLVGLARFILRRATGP